MSFPSSPVNGQQATVNNIVYIYDSTKDTWTRSGTISSTIIANSIVITNGAASTSTTTGAIRVTGGISSGGNVYADKFYTVNGLYWSGNGVAFVSGTAPAGLSGFVQYNNDGTLGASGLFYDEATGNIVANSTTISTSTTTGALVVAGGLGISGNINVNGITNVISGNVGLASATVPKGVINIKLPANPSYNYDPLVIENSDASVTAYPTTQASRAGIVIKGITSDARIKVQDGNGRLNDYWNAYTDASGYKYIVSSEPAARYLTSINSTTGATFAWYSAPAGTAGAALSWTQVGQIIGGTGGTAWFSPRGTSTDFIIYDTGNVRIGTTTTSTSTTTGALVVDGGIGLNGNLIVGGNILQDSAYYEASSNITNTGGNLTCNFNDGTVFYVTSLTANVTASFVNVNAINNTVSGVTLIVEQGATPYAVSNVQINGVFQTIRWPGGIGGPSPRGLANNTDIISFSLIHLSNGTYRVLGQLSSFG